jgi:hypothetical protein
MDIKPPYGYQDIVPLTKTHRVLPSAERRLPPAFASLNALPLSFTEFAPAARDYPIAFVSGDNGRSFAAMAVLGLENRQNLFVADDGAWDGAAYLPAYVRRYPFCMTRVTVSGQERPERIACVEKSALSDQGEALHDGEGHPLPAWEARRKLLFEFEADLARTEDMCRSLAQLGLFETFTMQAVPDQGQPLAMTGLYRASEQKLHDLPAEKLKQLAQTGVLARVYCHLLSLANFGRLLDRRAARSGTPASASNARLN